MARIKRNVKISDKLLRWLQMYANNTATINEIVSDSKYERYVEVGEYEESAYETAERIAQELCELCNIQGKPDQKIVDVEKEYMEGQM